MREIGISPRFSRDKFVPLQTKQRYSTRDISGEVSLTLFFRGFVPFLSLADFVSRNKNLQVADLQRLKSCFGELVTATTSNHQEGLPYFSVAFLFFALNLVCVGYYQSLGCFKTAILLMLLRGLVFVVPAFLVLPRVIGVPGLWLSVPLSEIMTQILILVYYLLNRNNKNISNL